MSDQSTTLADLLPRSCGSAARLAVLFALNRNPPGLTREQLVEHTGCSQEDVIAALDGLRHDGRIQATRKGPGAPWRLPYHVTGWRPTLDTPAAHTPPVQTC